MIPLGLKNDTTVYIAALEKGGFIILSADYTAPPVLGFCHKGTYDPDSLPGGLKYLIEGYQKSISSLREDKIEPVSEVNLKWDSYRNDADFDKDLKSGEMVSSSNQLELNTTWHQGYLTNQQNHYNRYCPPGCYAGCVAVAMAQILYYWNWDVNQTGTNSFDGQTVNFGNHEYCYDRMDTEYSDQYNSKLIYHAGVSCNTNYCESGNLSGADPDNARAAFENFGG